MLGVKTKHLSKIWQICLFCQIHFGKIKMISTSTNMHNRIILKFHHMRICQQRSKAARQTSFRKISVAGQWVKNFNYSPGIGSTQTVTPVFCSGQHFCTGLVQSESLLHSASLGVLPRVLLLTTNGDEHPPTLSPLQLKLRTRELPCLVRVFRFHCMHFSLKCTHVIDLPW